MKLQKSQGNVKHKDDTLFGLLLSYKSNNSYIRVLESEEEKRVIVQLTDNPKNWSSIPSDLYVGFRTLRRLEIGNSKLFVKYLKPVNIVTVLGNQLGINFPKQHLHIKAIDKIQNGGYYILEVPSKYKKRALQGVNKILNLSSQKKYEIIEKYLSANMDQEN